MRTIVAGSRIGATETMVEQAMQDAPWEITVVISGCAVGVDTWGERLAKKYDLPIEQYPAKWKDLTTPGAVIRQSKYGSYNAKAGHDRNHLMATKADALIAIWDGKSKGTENMIREANIYGLKIHIHPIYKEISNVC